MKCKKLKFWRQNYSRVARLFLDTNERLHNAERRGDFWRNVSCIIIALFFAFIFSVLGYILF